MKANRQRGFFESNSLIISLKHGLTLAIPFLLAGSLALTVISLPVPAYQEFLKAGLGATFRYFFNLIYQCTLGSLSLVLLVTVSYSYARTQHADTTSFYVLTAVCSYLISTYDSWSEGTNVFDATWSFSAILVALLSGALLFFLTNHTTKTRFYTQGAGHYFNMVMLTFFPILIVLVGFALVAGILNACVAGFHGANPITDGLVSLFSRMGSNIFSAIFYVLLMQVFWFFGVHGSNVVYPVALQLFYPNNQINQGLIAQGQAPTQIFTYSFFDSFVMIGGSGLCISLLIALLLVSKNQSNRKLARFAALPVCFNISELLILGLPVVFNPIMIIPFIAAPLASLLISSFAMWTGLVPLASNMVSWTTPPLIDGYLATGSIAGSVLQVVCIAVGVLIYIPFVRLSEKRQQEMLCENISGLTEYTMQAEEEGHFAVLLDDNSPLLGPAKVLVSDLRFAVKNRELQMFYQPQVSSDGKLYGVEALLRWKHPIGGYIYPPLIIGLASEDGFLDELGEQIIDMSCRDLALVASKLDLPMKATINVLPQQLENPNFCRRFQEIRSRYDLGGITVGLEFTEQIALSNTPNVHANLEQLRELGVPLIMDDFGVGHSSMMYLQDNHFDVVKIDGNLVRHLMDNERSESITRTITSLAAPLGFDVVAEYVETQKQREKLEELGCRIYQGYYYSKAVDLEDFVEYAEENFDGKREPETAQKKEKTAPPAVKN